MRGNPPLRSPLLRGVGGISVPVIECEEAVVYVFVRKEVVIYNGRDSPSVQIGLAVLGMRGAS